ncbi:MAG: lantibiotic dehydratase C-terminal domain-containing protein [Acidobacteriota bacterium]
MDSSTNANDRDQTAVALTIYRWTYVAQDQVLADCLQPALLELRDGGALRSFWFNRFDARGPHLKILLTLPEPDKARVVRDLERRLAAYLRENPETEPFSEEKAAERHANCQGKTLGEADRLPGLAERDTFVLTGHSSRDYPWLWSRDPGPATPFWDRVSDLSWWTLDQVADFSRSGGGRHGSALQLTHAVDRRLRQDQAWRTAFWRFCASVLLHFLGGERFDDPAHCLTAFPPWIGDSNMKVFADVWDHLDRSETGIDGMEGLVREARAQSDPDDDFRLLRETIFSGLSQLGLPTRLRATLFVFAWHRSLLEGEA